MNPREPQGTTDGSPFQSPTTLVTYDAASRGSGYGSSHPTHAFIRPWVVRHTGTEGERSREAPTLQTAGIFMEVVVIRRPPPINIQINFCDSLLYACPWRRPKTSTLSGCPFTS